MGSALDEIPRDVMSMAFMQDKSLPVNGDKMYRSTPAGRELARGFEAPCR
jgi:hypothetical protein